MKKPKKTAKKAGGAKPKKKPSTSQKAAASEKAGPRVHLRFAFHFANELAPVRRFYGEGLGMQELMFVDEERAGFLVYETEGLQLMFFRSEQPLPVRDDWASQPGWEGGTSEIDSWGIEVPEKELASTIERLRSLGAPFFKADPEWRQTSYWGVSVKDPMGRTIEVYSVPKKKPRSTVWSG
jgi:hypothetical protein